MASCKPRGLNDLAKLAHLYRSGADEALAVDDLCGLCQLAMAVEKEILKMTVSQPEIDRKAERQ